jgi:hypothetical protein
MAEEVHGHPGPGERPDHKRPPEGTQAAAEFRDLMNETSPDGRPPAEAVRRESLVLFVSVLAVVTLIVVTALIRSSGSIVPGLIALLLMLVFIGLAAWPAWNAGVDRKIEERHASDQIRGGHGKPT